MAHRPIEILIVDSSPEFLAAARAWLDRERATRVAGFARSGQEAIVAVARIAPDVVLMDAFLPGMDGFETATAIKGQPRAPIVILLCVHADPVVEMEAWAAGADAFVPKVEFGDRLPALLWNFFGGRARGVDSRTLTAEPGA